MTDRVEKTDQQWMHELTPEQFRVCRLKATEPPFSGKYNDANQDGTYRCVCCGNALYHSTTKFDSRSGWPSFFQPVAEDAVKVEEDVSLGMRRTEVMCARCDAHLGHGFDDGPEPTGQRHCINSVALKLVK